MIWMCLGLAAVVVGIAKRERRRDHVPMATRLLPPPPTCCDYHLILELRRRIRNAKIEE